MITEKMVTQKIENKYIIKYLDVGGDSYLECTPSTDTSKKSEGVSRKVAWHRYAMFSFCHLFILVVM